MFYRNNLKPYQLFIFYFGFHMKLENIYMYIFCYCLYEI